MVGATELGAASIPLGVTSTTDGAEGSANTSLSIGAFKVAG